MWECHQNNTSSQPRPAIILLPLLSTGSGWLQKREYGMNDDELLIAANINRNRVDEQQSITKDQLGNYTVVIETMSSSYIQSDIDRPRTARMFGWTPCAWCGHQTDGTVPCVHKTVDEMIEEATKFLDKIATMEEISFT